MTNHLQDTSALLVSISPATNQAPATPADRMRAQPPPPDFLDITLSHRRRKDTPVVAPTHNLASSALTSLDRAINTFRPTVSHSGSLPAAHRPKPKRPEQGSVLIARASQTGQSVAIPFVAKSTTTHQRSSRRTQFVTVFYHLPFSSVGSSITFRLDIRACTSFTVSVSNRQKTSRTTRSTARKSLIPILHSTFRIKTTSPWCWEQSPAWRSPSGDGCRSSRRWPTELRIV